MNLASIPVTFSCSVNMKICLWTNIASDIGMMNNVPLSLLLQILLYAAVGWGIILAKPKKKKPYS